MRNLLAVGVGDVDGAGTEQERRAPVDEERDVAEVGEDLGREAGHGVQPHFWQLENLVDLDATGDHRGQRAPQRVVGADGAEEHLGLRLRRDRRWARRRR